MQSIVPRRQNRAKCSYRTKLDCPRLTTHSHATRLSTNLDTKRRVYLERHGSDVTRVNTALAMLGRVHFTLVTIATMPPLVHNLLFWVPSLLPFCDFAGFLEGGSIAVFLYPMASIAASPFFPVGSDGSRRARR